MSENREIATGLNRAANGRALMLGIAIIAAILGLKGIVALALLTLAIAWLVDQLPANRFRAALALTSYLIAAFALGALLFNLG